MKIECFIRRPVLATFAVALPIGATTAQEAPDQDEHHDIEEIIVEATALPRTVQQLAQPTAVIRGAELARKQASSIGETVSQELGVSSTYFGPVASRPVIRGQYGERVRVLSNGLDSLDASALSEDHQTSVEGILADHIEIVRGPATLLYGSGAAGGLVNVVDNRIVEEEPDRPLIGMAALNGNSATGELAGAGWVAFGTERFVLHADYSRRDTDDVEIPGFAESEKLRALEAEAGEAFEEEASGVVENSDSSSETGALGVSLLGENGFLGVSASRFDSNYGVPGHAHEEEVLPGVPAEEEAVRIDLAQDRVDLRAEYEFSGPLESIHFRAARNTYDHTEFEGAETGTIYETDGLDARLELKHGRFGQFDGAVGAQFKRIDFNAIGEEAFVPATDTRRTSIFAFEEMSLSDTFLLQGSARIERQEIQGATIAERYDETAFGASVGAIWYFSPVASLAANVALTERHPNATELYADGPHVAVQRFERGSVTLGDGLLDKEVTANIDLTLRGNTDRVDWTLTAFLNRADDYIVLKPTPAVEDGFTVFEYRQADAELYGYELETRIELLETNAGHHLHTRLFSDYVRGEERASGDYLPRLPPLRFGAALHYTMERLELSGEVSVFADQDKVAPNELPTDGYVLVGATVSYSLIENGLFLFLSGANLGDEEARQHSSPLKDVVPLPGRAVHAGIRYEF